MAKKEKGDQGSHGVKNKTPLLEAVNTWEKLKVHPCVASSGWPLVSLMKAVCCNVYFWPQDCLGHHFLSPPHHYPRTKENLEGFFPLNQKEARFFFPKRKFYILYIWLRWYNFLSAKPKKALGKLITPILFCLNTTWALLWTGPVIIVTCPVQYRSRQNDGLAAVFLDWAKLNIWTWFKLQTNSR